MTRKPHIVWTLFRLWLAWRKYPQLRLGQLIDNSFHWAGANHHPYLFNVHDETIIERVDYFIKRGEAL